MDIINELVLASVQKLRRYKIKELRSGVNVREAFAVDVALAQTMIKNTAAEVRGSLADVDTDKLVDLLACIEYQVILKDIEGESTAAMFEKYQPSMNDPVFWVESLYKILPRLKELPIFYGEKFGAPRVAFLSSYASSDYGVLDLYVYSPEEGTPVIIGQDGDEPHENITTALDKNTTLLTSDWQYIALQRASEINAVNSDQFPYLEAFLQTSGLLGMGDTVVPVEENGDVTGIQFKKRSFS